MEQKDEFKCIICDKQQAVLLKVEVQGDMVFPYARGVCQDCLKNKDINKVCRAFAIRKTKEQISELEGSMETFKAQLKELEGM